MSPIPGFPPMGAPPVEMPPVDMPLPPAAAGPMEPPMPAEEGPGPGAKSILAEIMGKLADLETRLASVESGGGAVPPAIEPPMPEIPIEPPMPELPLPPAGTPETSLPPALPV